MCALAYALVSLSGCWGRGQALPQEPAISVLGLRVEDAASGRWSTSETPRSPQLRLDFDAEASRLAPSVWLVEGTGDGDVIADLLDPPLRKGTTERIIPYTSQSLGDTLTVTPVKPLAPGAVATLVFARKGSDVFSATLRVSASPFAGASLVASLPMHGAHAVPTNTSEMLLQFDGVLDRESAPRITLEGGKKKRTVELAFTTALRTARRDIAFVRLPDALAPATRYTLRMNGLRDATSAPLGEQTITFDTAEGPSADPARMQELPCATDEEPLSFGACLVASEHSLTVRFSAGEPVFASLRSGERENAAVCGAEACELTLASLSAETPHSLVLALRNVVGQLSELTFVASTTRPLAKMRVEEARIDPIGSEPAQEFVELLNFGPEPVSIMGFSLSDDAFDEGRVVTNALTVQPFERVLAVAPTFDARDERDGALAPGVRLARLSGPLSLSNAGASLVLRDDEGHRLDQTPKLTAPAGHCAARQEASSPHERPVFAAAPCSPGEVSTWR